LHTVSSAWLRAPLSLVPPGGGRGRKATFSAASASTRFTSSASPRRRDDESSDGEARGGRGGRGRSSSTGGRGGGRGGGRDGACLSLSLPLSLSLSPSLALALSLSLPLSLSLSLCLHPASGTRLLLLHMDDSPREPQARALWAHPSDVLPRAQWSGASASVSAPLTTAAPSSSFASCHCHTRTHLTGSPCLSQVVGAAAGGELVDVDVAASAVTDTRREHTAAKPSAAAAGCRSSADPWYVDFRGCPALCTRRRCTHNMLATALSRGWSSRAATLTARATLAPTCTAARH
jgi:hypothetical protein